MKVAVIGGGWYGCHIGSALKAYGVPVRLFEKEDRLFAEASGNNQFRLHLGLHYPRSAVTRHQSRDGYSRFSERYPRFSKPVARNIYVVPKAASLVDFETYFAIMLSSGIQIDKVPVESLDFLRPDLVSGALSCAERVVQTAAARAHFARELGDVVQLGARLDRLEPADGGRTIFGERFDYVVDATWGALRPGGDAYYFEPTLLLYYRYTGPGTFPALTLVDGELWSIYPTEREGISTLSSVAHTPLGRYRTKSEAYRRLADVRASEVLRRRHEMEREVREYFPDFLDRFEYLEPQLSIKMKPVGRADDRSASVERDGRLFRVHSGKIDTIFHAGDAILGALVHA